MTRFFLLPGQNYTGPGNSTSRAYRRRHPPTDALDRASLQHDLRYQRLIERQGRFRTYTHFSGADASYLRRIQHLPGWRAGLASGVFQVKAAVAPTMPKRGRSRSRSGSRASSTPYKVRRAAPPPPRHKSASVSGHYKGRLPRPTKAPRPGAVAIRGHRAEVQQYGKVEHPYVAYLGAQVAPAGRIGQSVGMAFIRMVMKKHWHFEYTSTEQFLLGGSGVYNAVVPFDLRFWRKAANANGPPSASVEATFSFNNNPAASVRSFGEWFNTNVFHGAAFNGGQYGPGSNIELHAYQFSQFDFNDGSAGVPVVLSVVPLTDQYVRCYSTVRMHIQNVTPSDAVDVNSLSTDRVDSNPVKGRLMRFRDPTPLVRDDRGVEAAATSDFGWKLQQDSNGDGIIWPGTPQPTGQWSALPGADAFKNCVGISSISLEPGAIKDYSLNFKFSGTIQALMRGFNTSSSLNVPIPSAFNKQFGQSFMFALEKRMPTGASAVMLNFNYENHYGAVFGGRPVQPMARQSVQLGTAVADAN